MKAKPILMHGRSIQNLLAGRKTQTRRIINRVAEWGPVTDFGASDTPGYAYHFRDRRGRWNDCKERAVWSRCPYGRPGDLLYVRETWADEGDWIAYRADRRDEDGYLDPPGIKYRPSIHMPRWVSRITLHLTDVRVERVQDINGYDAYWEGVNDGDGHRGGHPSYTIMEFRRLWNDTNGASAWERNDWVWVLEFRVIHANVDDVLVDPERYGIQKVKQ